MGAGIKKVIKRKNNETEETWDYVDQIGDLHMIKITRHDDGFIKNEELVSSNGKKKTLMIKTLSNDGFTMTEDFADEISGYS